MSIWQIQTNHFLLPKSGIELSECEDAIGVNEPSYRFAIADGATEAFDSRSWAQLLVNDWVQLDPIVQTAEDFATFVAKQAQTLHDSWRDLKLSWYSEEKARDGSYAAFVGLQLELDESSPRWRAIALGDSCFMHCRNDKILTSFPILRPEDFNATPLLVPSHSSLRHLTFERVAMKGGLLQDGDVLMLLSDAAACWYLRKDEQMEQLRSSFDMLLKTNQNVGLLELISAQREGGRMVDDDIAVIRIEVSC